MSKVIILEILYSANFANSARRSKRKAMRWQLLAVLAGLPAAAALPWPLGDGEAAPDPRARAEALGFKVLAVTRHTVAISIGH